MPLDTPQPIREARCDRCWQSSSLCWCREIPKLTTCTRLLVLQHPQEAKRPASTARLLTLAIEGAVHRVGLSWRSLPHALGEPAEPSEWAVLYLGSQRDRQKFAVSGDSPLVVLDRKGETLPLKRIRGVVMLDGTWKQSKTMWWRNPWLLKLNRAALKPPSRSQYGLVRKQPRVDCLSTIEAGAEALRALEGEIPAVTELAKLFRQHLEKVASLPH